eukprot:TRINITY_DN27607_c0_g1_i1.p3 TRINITY_DN27607_c0_g1~~TRINITY_DN27607_c0_g1_i1.p3  ORF type:complete len:102 (-),score=16.69 TRINITY_DN27607_c0_g1_i1:80-385(-)
MFLATFFVIEFSIFFATAPCNIAMMECVPEHLRSISVAVCVMAIHLLGDCPSPVITGYFIDNMGWRAAMALLGSWNIFQLLFWGLSYVLARRAQAVESDTY